MSGEKKNVLLVDDDPGMLFPLARDLSMGNEPFDLVTAREGFEALDILEREDIALVVSDVKMPRMSGFDLLTRIRKQFPHIGVILMTAHGTEKMRQAGRESGCLHFLEKPFGLDHLKQLIREQLARCDSGFSGTLRNILLSDLIQMCCLAMSRIAIRVTNGNREGTLYIDEGEIIHATSGELEGEEAFYQIMAWGSGTFESMAASPLPVPNIDKPWEHLLMEGARLSDEVNFEPEDIDTPAVAPDRDEHRPLRVLIVDDSAVMCRILTDLLSDDPAVETVGTARNGEEALQKIERLRPDLITLDVNMPVMSGGTALKHIMIKNRCPVVIVSNPGRDTTRNILDFLLLGAVDFIRKPKKVEDMARQQAEISSRIKLAGSARTGNFKRLRIPGLHLQAVKNPIESPARHLVIVLSGPGGYPELIKLVSMMPADIKSCLVAIQTMPPEFAGALADFIDRRSPVTVKPLDGPSPLIAGRCYIGSGAAAPGFQDASAEPMMLIPGSTAAHSLHSPETGERTREFFRQAIERFPGRVSGVILSGAPVTDSSLFAEFRENRGRIIVKQPESCLVPDPLERIIAAGQCEHDLNLDAIARHIVEPDDRITNESGF